MSDKKPSTPPDSEGNSTETRRDFIKKSSLITAVALIPAKYMDIIPTSSIMTSDKQFNPDEHLIVPAKTFKQLAIGDIFRAPSRTLTDAHSSAFQAVSCDNHPVHYDEVWAAKHGHSKPVVHGLQVLAFTAPGATLFPHYIGEVFIAFTELSCSFLKEVHAGDTLYSELEIVNLTPAGQNGLVETKVSVHNQRGELVLSGMHKYLLKV